MINWAVSDQKPAQNLPYISRHHFSCFGLVFGQKQPNLSCLKPSLRVPNELAQHQQPHWVPSFILEGVCYDTLSDWSKYDQKFHS